MFDSNVLFQWFQKYVLRHGLEVDREHAYSALRFFVYGGNDGLGFLRAGTRHKKTKLQIKPEDRTTLTHLGPARKNS
jgi:hypothetical protein